VCAVSADTVLDEDSKEKEEEGIEVRGASR